MSTSVEMVGRDGWEDFLSAPVAVLILAKSDCGACKTWQGELDAHLAGTDEFDGARFGKLNLDQPGLVAFKRANPWLSGVTDLPTNVLYVKGEKTKTWVGGGVDRLANRLRRVLTD